MHEFYNDIHCKNKIKIRPPTSASFQNKDEKLIINFAWPNEDIFDSIHKDRLCLLHEKLGVPEQALG